MSKFILCGMQFGDEGKGTFVDYLVHENKIDCVVKYNGGSQASHTVITPSGVLHKFSQLGSGMFYEPCHTYITENMVVNLDNLMVEFSIFAPKVDSNTNLLRERMHIHENCYVVTPYHKLINKLRELSNGDNRRGSVGTGVSEVMNVLSETGIGLQVKNLVGIDSQIKLLDAFHALRLYALDLYLDNANTIWDNVPKEMKESLNEEIIRLLKTETVDVVSPFIHKFQLVPEKHSFRQCLYNDYNIIREKKNVVFEGSQGLLIDNVFGIKPNTTFLDTTNLFARSLCENQNAVKIGLVKAFETRHGQGIFPTESSDVSDQICDLNQDSSFWNGSIRFGWFDAVLLRYAQKINQVDELYLSALDKLSDFDTIRVCDEYIYHGEIDNTFPELFDYYVTSDGRIIVKNIKTNDDSLINYLRNCEPKYIEVNGWEKDISHIKKKNKLPNECLQYIELLEKLTGIHISVASVGPTREEKIKL